MLPSHEDRVSVARMRLISTENVCAKQKVTANFQDFQELQNNMFSDSDFYADHE